MADSTPYPLYHDHVTIRASAPLSLEEFHKLGDHAGRNLATIGTLVKREIVRYPAGSPVTQESMKLAEHGIVCSTAEGNPTISGNASVPDEPGVLRFARTTHMGSENFETAGLLMINIRPDGPQKAFAQVALHKDKRTVSLSFSGVKDAPEKLRATLNSAYVPSLWEGKRLTPRCGDA